jgi:hypothetical protein
MLTRQNLGIAPGLLAIVGLVGTPCCSADLRAPLQFEASFSVSRRHRLRLNPTEAQRAESDILDPMTVLV